jgi:hypothetical protein
MPNTFSGADAYVAKRIADTPSAIDPFPHCVVDDVFPPDLFEAIHENWPGDDVMIPLPETGRTSEMYKQRHAMLMSDDFLSKLGQDGADFWTSVSLAAMGGAVVRACWEKFKDVLFPRVEHLGGSIDLSPELLVISDREHYSIGPHTDTKARFISLLYYLSREPEYASYGTGLYVPKDPDMEIRDHTHYRFQDFDLHSRVDFKPNRLVAFPRSDRSLHGVYPVPIPNCDRRLLIVNIRAPEGAA